MQSTLPALYDLIAALFKRPISLSPETIRWIDGCYSSPTAAEIARILADDEDSQSDCLLQLLLTPDEAVCEKVEACLPGAGLVGESVQKLARRLLSSFEAVQFAFPDRPGLIRVALTPDRLGDFLDGLYLERKIAPPLLTAIDRHVPNNAGLSPETDAARQLVCRFRLRLRRMRRPLSDDRIEFLNTFTAAYREPADHYLDCLDTLIEFLDDVPPDQSLEDALMARRRFLTEGLQRAEQLGRWTADRTMEERMARGVHLPHVDRQAIGRQMEMIDRVSLIVFNRSANPNAAALQTDLGSHEGRSGLNQVFRILS